MNTTHEDYQVQTIERLTRIFQKLTYVSIDLSPATDAEIDDMATQACQLLTHVNDEFRREFIEHMVVHMTAQLSKLSRKLHQLSNRAAEPANTSG